VVGSQTWMAENLNYTADSSWCYLRNPSYCETYGRLYTWKSAMAGLESSGTEPSGVQGVCPSGWHLPSFAEWRTLRDYADANSGGDPSGYHLKSTSGWLDDGNGSDAFGLSLTPGGYDPFDHLFEALGTMGTWWSSTVAGYPSAAYYMFIVDSDDYFYSSNTSKKNALSVRCLKN